MRVNFTIFLLVVMTAGFAFPGKLLASSPLVDVPRLRAQAQTWLEQHALQAYPGSYAQVSVGDIDPRLRFPTCTDTRFFLPANARLWGHGSVGVRCEAPVPWSFYLSYQNRLIGPALIATRPIAAREQLSNGDVEVRQVEYTLSPDLYPRELPANVHVNRPVPAGQAIVISWLSLPTVIKSGSKVRLNARTAAFTVTQQGTALNAATPGEMVRVKTPGGRIVQGIANSNGTVDVRP